MEYCIREICNKRCSKVIKCGCQCLGLCGEVCPNVCRVEDHKTDKDVFEIFFGFEDEPDALFYQMNCPGKHVFEVGGLD